MKLVLKRVMFVGALLMSLGSLSAANAGLIYGDSNSYSFDGSSPLTIAYDASFSLQSPFSVAATFEASSFASDWVRIFGRGNGSNRNYGLWYRAGGTGVLFQASAAGGDPYQGPVVSNTLAVDTLYTLVGIYNGSTLRVYLDGILVGSTPYSGSIAVNNDPLTLGGAPNLHSLFSGKISDVGLWNHALSTEEIANYNENGIPVPEPSTIAIFALSILGLASRRLKK